MFRISKMTDYATIVMANIVKLPEEIHTAREIAQKTSIPSPTVKKILKKYAQQGFLNSSRGAQGGYQLSRAANEITLAEVIEAMEGAPGITSCVSDPGACSLESVCHMQDHWHLVTTEIYQLLKKMKLSEVFNYSGNETNSPQDISS